MRACLEWTADPPNGLHSVPVTLSRRLPGQPFTAEQLTVAACLSSCQVMQDIAARGRSTGSSRSGDWADEPAAASTGAML